MSRLRRLLPSPRSLFIFEAAARLCSFKQAAIELRTTQPNVSRAIKELEEHCQIHLFIRSPGGVQLSEAGKQFYASVCRGFQIIEQGMNVVLDNQCHITLAASTYMAVFWRVPRIPAFQKQHPDIKIKIMTTDRDIEPEYPVDMTFWIRPHDFKRAGAVHLCDEVIFPLCSATYIKSAVPLEKPQDLLQHRLIHAFDAHRNRMDWHHWLAFFDLTSNEAELDLLFDDMQMSLQAALAGEGIALGWSMTSWFLRQKKQLIRPLAEEVRTGNAFFAVCNEHSAKSKAMPLLVQWLMNEVQGADASYQDEHSAERL